MKEVKEKRYIKIFILVVAILLTIKVLFYFDTVTGIFSYIMGIIRPFVFGFIIAYCINIPVAWLERSLYKVKFKWMQKLARPISIVICLAVLVGGIVFGLMNLIPMIIENASSLIDAMPDYIDTGVKALKGLPFADELGIGRWLENLNAEEVLAFLPSFKVNEVTEMATGFFSGIFTIFLTIVATIYFLAEYNKIKEFLKRFIRAHSPKRQRPAIKYIRLVDKSFRKFLTCQFLDSLILGTITMIEFTIMKSNYAVTLGLMLGVLNIIPYFGAIFGSMLAVFIIWATNGLEIAIITAIMLLITQQIDGNFINPRIMGTSFKISPVIVIIAITIGGAVGKVMGMIFAIPVANVLKTLLEEYIANKEQHKPDAKGAESSHEPQEKAEV